MVNIQQKLDKVSISYKCQAKNNGEACKWHKRFVIIELTPFSPQITGTQNFHATYNTVLITVQKAQVHNQLKYQPQYTTDERGEVS